MSETEQSKLGPLEGHWAMLLPAPMSAHCAQGSAPVDLFSEWTCGPGSLSLDYSWSKSFGSAQFPVSNRPPPAASKARWVSHCGTIEGRMKLGIKNKVEFAKHLPPPCPHLSRQACFWCPKNSLYSSHLYTPEVFFWGFDSFLFSFFSSCEYPITQLSHTHTQR